MFIHFYILAIIPVLLGKIGGHDYDEHPCRHARYETKTRLIFFRNVKYLNAVKKTKASAPKYLACVMENGTKLTLTNKDGNAVQVTEAWRSYSQRIDSNCVNFGTLNIRKDMYDSYLEICHDKGFPYLQPSDGYYRLQLYQQQDPVELFVVMTGVSDVTIFDPMPNMWKNPSKKKELLQKLYAREWSDS